MKITHDPRNPVPIDGIAWRQIGAYFNRPVSEDAMRALSYDQDLQRMEVGDASGLGRLLDRIEELENQFVEARRRLKVSDSPAEPSMPSFSGRVFFKYELETLERQEWNPTASPQFVLSGIIFRLAEHELKAICDIVRPVILRYSPTAAQIDPYRLERWLQRHTQGGAQSGRELHKTLASIATLEEQDDVPPILREATQSLGHEILLWRQSHSSITSLRIAMGGEKSLTVATELNEEFSFNPDYKLRKVRFKSSDGFLGQLKLLVRLMMIRYRWTEDGCLHFLGVPPGYGIITVAEVRFDCRDDESALSRITLTVDPTLSPDEVKAIYARARNQVIKGNNKELSQKSLLLVNHVYTQTARDTSEDSNKWHELMHEWNRLFATSVKGQRGKAVFYRSVAQFKRDAQQAKERLLNPEIERPTHEVQYPSLRSIKESSSRKKADQ